MGIIEWKLVVKRDDIIIEKITSRYLGAILLILYDKLFTLNATDSFDKGSFVETKNPFKNETLIKRYVIDINCPYTRYEVIKQTKGSLNPEIVMASIKLIKEKYEGV